MKGLVKALLSVSLIGGGLAMAGDGIWIKSKAVLAQYLLDDAWRRVQQGEVEARPWSWADTWPVARLSVKRIGVEQFVLSGSSGRVLAFGPGHIAGTAPPGSVGNTVLSGHRDTHFTWLAKLQAGDQIDLDLPDGRVAHYAVERRSVHHESETDLLAQGQGNILSLITCYPFDALIPGGDQRYVVTARRLVF